MFCFPIVNHVMLFWKKKRKKKAYDVTGQLPEYCFFQKSSYLCEYTTYVYIA